MPEVSESLVDATARALAKHGIDRLTLDHVAAEAGVTRPEIDALFGSTEEALREMVIGTYVHFGAYVNRVVSEAGDGSQAMTAYVSAFYRYYMQRLSTFRAAWCARQLAPRERFGLSDEVLHQQLFPTVRAVFDGLEAKLLADKGPSELAGGIHPRRLAFVTSLAATGLVVTKGLGVSLQSDFLHTDEQLLSELTGALGAATSTVKQMGALNAASGALAGMRSEAELIASVPLLFEQALVVSAARLWRVEDGHLEAGAPVIATAAFAARRTAHADRDDVTELATVIRFEGELAAVLVAARDRALGESDVARIETFAAMVGLALENVRLYENLQSQVEARTAELRAAQVALVQREKMAAAGTLVAGLAHEINTPMASVLASAAAMRTALAKLPSAAEPREARLHGVVHQAAETMRVGGDRIAALLDKLKRFSHLDASDLARVDLNQSLRDVIAILQRELPEGCAVADDLDPELPAIDCFVAQLNQVWFNVLLNAAQSRGVSRITLRSRGVADGVEVTIADDGEGIAADALPRVFDPGFTGRGVGVGAGMGLAIAYRAVQAHRGSITVESLPGAGARVKVCLPLQPK